MIGLWSIGTMASGAGTRPYTGSKAAQDDGQTRQAPIQTAQPHRDCVWQAQGLETLGDTPWPQSQGLPLSHRARCCRHLLVMKPDPNSLAK